MAPILPWLLLMEANFRDSFQLPTPKESDSKILETGKHKMHGRRRLSLLFLPANTRRGAFVTKILRSSAHVRSKPKSNSLWWHERCALALVKRFLEAVLGL
jgi:hypothetical protein